MVEDARRLGAVDFDISGGDPLTLGKNFVVETIRCAAGRGMTASLSTNAQNLSMKYLEELGAVGLQKIKLSLYGVTADTHDDFTRVPGSFEKLINGITLCGQAGMEVWVNCVVTPANVEELRTLASVLGPLEVDLVQLTSVVPCGRGEHADSLRFSEDGLERAIRMLEGCLDDLEYAFTITLFPDPHMLPFEGRHCDYFHERLVVAPDGNVIPCCLLPARLQHSLGNAREGLAEVCTERRIQRDPVFHWLARGHEAMRRTLAYEGVSHNLCAVCIDMLSRLNEGGNKGHPASG
jgi:MoaA/NifB/PqqE/SkfB family radical SAM enzyme